MYHTLTQIIRPSGLTVIHKQVEGQQICEQHQGHKKAINIELDPLGSEGGLHTKIIDQQVLVAAQEVELHEVKGRTRSGKVVNKVNFSRFKILFTNCR